MSVPTRDRAYIEQALRRCEIPKHLMQEEPHPCMWVYPQDTIGDDHTPANENFSIRLRKEDEDPVKWFAEEQPFDIFARTGKFTKRCPHEATHMLSGCHYILSTYRAVMPRYYCKHHMTMILKSGRTGKNPRAITVAHNKQHARLSELAKSLKQEAAEAEVVQQPWNHRPDAGSIPVRGKEK